MSARANYEIQELNASLADVGETVKIRRLVGTALSPISCTVRALVRRSMDTQLVGTTTQEVGRAVLSPSELTAAGWPGPPNPVPRGNDKLVDTAGQVYNIESSLPIYVDDVLVRIDLKFVGG